MTPALPATDPPPRLLSTAVGQVAVTDEGPAQAPALLFAHGLPGTSQELRYLAPRLLPAWRVLRVEMPGFGLSPASHVRTLAAWAAVLAAVRDSLSLRRPLLLGYSFGGGACLLAAAAEPAAWRGLVLVASLGLRVHPAMRWAPATYARLAAGVRSRWTRLPLLLLGRLSYRRLRLAPPTSWHELLLHLELLSSVDFVALTAAARAADLPTLVTFGRDDRVTLPTIQEELAAMLPAAAVLPFSTGGHQLHKHRAVELAAAITERFLDESD